MQFDQSRFVVAVLLIALLGGNVSFAQNKKTRSSRKDDANLTTTVLRGATVHPMDGQPAFVGSVAISDGKIVAVGKKIETPKDAKVIELEGCHLVPGLIESRGKLWLTTAARTEANTKATLNVVDAIDPWSEDLRELAAQGITSVYVQPVSTSFLGGYGAVLRVGPHGSPEAIVLKDEVAVQASIGLTGKTSKDRYTQFKQLEKLFETAKKALEKDKQEAAKKDDQEDASEDSDEAEESEDEEDDGDSGDEKAESNQSSSSSSSSTDNTVNQALGRVLNKEIPLHVEVHHSDSLNSILELAKKYEIRLVIDGLSQVENCCQAIVDAGYPMVVGPLYETAAVPDYREDADFSWLAEATESNPLWSLSSFSADARSSRLLRMQAAMAIQHGVKHDQALAALTSNAARMLGVGDQVGTISAGKQADLAVFTGDPLDPSSVTRLVMSGGKITFDAATLPVESSASQVFEFAGLPTKLPAEYAIKTTRFLKAGKFVPATLRIKNGQVVSTSAKAKLDGITVFDLKDAVVSPGLVAASSSLGQSTAIVDSTESDASHLRAVDAIDPSTEKSKQFLAGGFVHIGVSPGNTNTSAGVVGHVRLGAIDYVANPTIASQFVLAGSARDNERFPASVNGQIQLLSDLLDGKPAQSSVYVTSLIGRSIRDEKLQNIEAIKTRDRKTVFYANSKLEINAAIRLAKQHKLDAVLMSSGQVGDLAEKLAEQKIGLIVPALGSDDYQTQLDQIVSANRAGVPIAFAGESPEKIRVTAALLASAGLPAEAALQGLTDGGADMIGMKHVHLAKKAPADFVIWSHSPLNLSAQPVHVVVDGQIVPTK